jgi:hypothetical protein
LVTSDLPMRDPSRFLPIDAIACGTDGGQPLILAGGQKGVYRSVSAVEWKPSANQSTADVVTVPGTWLLCSGEHKIKVVQADATSGD